MTDNRCGTVRGYQDHVRNRTPKCAPCKRAYADRRAAYRRECYLNRGPLYVDITGTRRRVRALAAIGWPLGYQAQRLGMGKTWTHDTNLNRRVRGEVAEKVRALYGELSMIVGPSTRARAHARKEGWPPPLAWDDDTIDDPRARPVLGSALDRKAGVVPDEVAIQRAMRGYEVRLRPVERSEAVHRLTAAGHTAPEIARRIRIEERSVQRIRDAYRPQGEAS